MIFRIIIKPLRLNNQTQYIIDNIDELKDKTEVYEFKSKLNGYSVIIAVNININTKDGDILKRKIKEILSVESVLFNHKDT